MYSVPFEVVAFLEELFSPPWLSLEPPRLHQILTLVSRVPHKNFYRTQVSLGSDLWVRLSLCHTPFADLTDVTLVDEDTKSILTDNANRAIQGNQAMHVT